MRGENSGNYKVDVKNKQLVAVDYSNDENSGGSDSNDDSDDHVPTQNLKKSLRSIKRAR